MMPMKPDGTVRITTDFSPLNQYVVPTRYPLPLPDELFIQARGSKFFSKLDLVKAFHQIELHLDSRTHTCMLTPLGPCQYRQLQLGLKDSGAVCQKIVQEMLAGIDGVVSFIDDILIFAPTWEAHDVALCEVLCHLQAHDFHIQPHKCIFRVSELPFLGRILSGEGTKPDQENIKAIQDAHSPTNTKQICSFLSARRTNASTA